MVPAEALAGLAGVALFAVPGAGLAEVFPAVRARPLAHRLAYGYLLGIAWIAGGLYALSHFFSVPLRPPAILALAIPPALAGLISRLRRGRPRRFPANPRPPWERAAVAVAAVISLAALAQTLYTPLTDWDGRMTWGAQARYLRAEGTVDASVIKEPGWFVSLPWYPLLMPIAQVAVQEVTGAGDDQPFFRPLYVAFLPVWLLLIHGGARRLGAGSAAAAWTAAAAALLPFPALFNGGGAVSAYSDLPLACFYGAALTLLLERRPRLSGGLAAGLLLAGAVLTKTEGVPLAAAALTAAGLRTVLPWGSSSVRRRRWRLLRMPLGAALLPAALALGLLSSWRSGIPEVHYQEYRDLFRFDFGPQILARIPYLAGQVRYEMVALLDWGIFCSVAPLVLLAGWRGLRRRTTLPLLLATAAPLALAWTAYSLAVEPGFFVRTTWNRFLVQASVPFLILFACALGDLLRRVPRVPASLGGRARSRCSHIRVSARTPPAAPPPSASPGPARPTG